MRALVICPRVPPKPGSAGFGSDRRIRLFIEAIAQVCRDVSFLYFLPQSMVSRDLEAEFPSRDVWGIPGGSTFVPMATRTETFRNHYLAGLVTASGVQNFFPFTGSHQVEAVRAAMEPKPDLVFACQLQSMLPVLAARPSAPVLFDLDDLIHRVHWRTATSGRLHPGKMFYALQVPAILAAELRASRLAARTAVCAEADRRFLARRGAGNRVVIVPNAVACPAAPSPIPSAPTLLFLGNYDYAPNLQAAERLVTGIWPLVLKACSGAQLLLAGGGSDRLPGAAAPPPGVRYLGFVPDLDELYAGARVVCCPMDVGGGTRVKLIEAAAYGRPLVSTRVGAEGLDFRDGVEVVLRDDDVSFAASCVELLTNDVLCTRLGAAARLRTQQRYESGAVRRSIAALVKEVVGAG